MTLLLKNMAFAQYQAISWERNTNVDSTVPIVSLLYELTFQLIKSTIPKYHSMLLPPQSHHVLIETQG